MEKLPLNIISNSEISTRDFVIKILSSEWPLSIKKIHNRIKKSGRDISYQAVHKVIKELLDKGIITKKNMEYELSIEYIEKLNVFSQRLKESYVKSGTQKEKMFAKEFSMLKFERVTDMAKFLLQIISDNPEGQETVVLTPFFYVPFWMSKKEIEGCSSILESKKVYWFCKGSSAADRYFSKMWEKFGIKVKTGANIGFDLGVGMLSLFIHRDMLIFIRAFKWWEEYQEIYEKIQNMDDFDIAWTIKGCHKDQCIHVFIIRNAELADQIRNEALEYYDLE